MLTTRILDIIHEYGIDSIHIEKDINLCEPTMRVTLRKGNFKSCQFFSIKDIILSKDFDYLFVHWLEEACSNLNLMYNREGIK